MNSLSCWLQRADGARNTGGGSGTKRDVPSPKPARQATAPPRLGLGLERTSNAAAAIVWPLRSTKPDGALRGFEIDPTATDGVYGSKPTLGAEVPFSPYWSGMAGLPPSPPVPAVPTSF